MPVGRFCQPCQEIRWDEPFCTVCGTEFGKAEAPTRIVADGWKGGFHHGLNRAFPAGTSKAEMTDYAKRTGRTIEWNGRLLPVGERFDRVDRFGELKRNPESRKGMR